MNPVNIIHAQLLYVKMSRNIIIHIFSVMVLQAVWTDEAHCGVWAATRVCSVVWWLKYSLGMSAAALVSPSLQMDGVGRVSPLFQLCPSHNDKLCDVRGKSGTSLPEPLPSQPLLYRLPFLRISNTLENRGSCCTSHSLHSGSQKQEWKTLLGTF